MRRRAVASERVGVAVVRSLGQMRSSQDLPRPHQLLNCCGRWEPLSVKPAVVGCWRLVRYAKSKSPVMIAA